MLINSEAGQQQPGNAPRTAFVSHGLTRGAFPCTPQALILSAQFRGFQELKHLCCAGEMCIQPAHSRARAVKVKTRCKCTKQRAKSCSCSSESSHRVVTTLHWNNVKFTASSTFKLKKKKSVPAISVNTPLKIMKVGLASNT